MGHQVLLKDNCSLQPRPFHYLASYKTTGSTVELEGKTLETALSFQTVPELSPVYNIYICSTTLSQQQCEILPSSDVT